MTIALFGISSIYNGFQKFMNAAVHFDNELQTKFTSTSTNRPVMATSPLKNKAHPHQRALRVLRVSEHGETSSCAGRMVISGRMADVCAELDRLVALEAKNKPSLPH